MVKEIKETKEVVQETVVDIELYCDFCGKLINKDSDRKYEAFYYKLITGHNDWGNDSIDSYEFKDCCEECLPDQFIKYLTESCKENPTAFFKVEQTNRFYFYFNGEE